MPCHQVIAQNFDFSNSCSWISVGSLHITVQLIPIIGLLHHGCYTIMQVLDPSDDTPWGTIFNSHWVHLQTPIKWIHTCGTMYGVLIWSGREICRIFLNALKYCATFSWDTWYKALDWWPLSLPVCDTLYTMVFDADSCTHTCRIYRGWHYGQHVKHDFHSNLKLSCHPQLCTHILQKPL